MQCFEKEKEYNNSAQSLERILRRLRLEVLRGPFYQLLMTDRRGLRMCNLLERLRQRSRKMWFEELVRNCYLQAKSHLQIQRIVGTFKRKQMRITLVNLRVYFISRGLIVKAFRKVSKGVWKQNTAHLQYFFQFLRDSKPQKVCESPYEIDIGKHTPGFSSDLSEGEGITDLSTERKRFQNIFNYDGTSESKHNSHSRVEYLDTFQGYGSKDELVIKHSNFNTFYQADKEVSSPETHVNSYCTFKNPTEEVNKSSPFRVESYQAKEAMEDKRLVTIEDLGEELEDVSRSETMKAEDDKFVISPKDEFINSNKESFGLLAGSCSSEDYIDKETRKGLLRSKSREEMLRKADNSADNSQISGKSDQASFSIEKKKDSNKYSVKVKELLAAKPRKRREILFDVDKLRNKPETQKSNTFESLRSLKKKFESQECLDQNAYVFPRKPRFLQKSNRTRSRSENKRRPRSRVKAETDRQMNMFRMQRRDSPLSQKLPNFDNPRTRLNKKPMSYSLMNNSAISETLEPPRDNSSMYKPWNTMERNKSRNRSRLLISPNRRSGLLDRAVKKNTALRSKSRNKSKRRAKSRVTNYIENYEKNKNVLPEKESWDIQKSTILKSNISRINHKVEENFKSKMRRAIQSLAKELRKDNANLHRREKLLFSFVTVIQLFEHYLKTLQKGGNGSPEISQLSQSIGQISAPIKRIIQSEKFHEEIRTLKFEMLLRILTFLDSLLDKQYLKSKRSSTSQSSQLPEFGTASSKGPSQGFSSNVEIQSLSKSKPSLVQSHKGVFHSGSRFVENYQDRYYSKEGFKEGLKGEQRRVVHSRWAISQEAANFCILINCKLKFKFKKTLRQTWKLLKQQPRQLFVKGARRLPLLVAKKMKHKMLISLKMLKINKIQQQILYARNKHDKKKHRRERRRYY